MSDTPDSENRKSKPPKRSRSERALDLAKKRYELRRATRWPYARRGEQTYRFEGQDRNALRADLKWVWRQKYTGENPPSDTQLNSVIADLKRLALDADPDPETDEEFLAANGVGVPSPDRVFDLPGCPLPGGYRIPEPYQAEPGGILSVQADEDEGRSKTQRVTWAPLFPLTVYADHDGDQMIELTWWAGHHWIRRTVPRSIAKSGRRLVAALGDAGLPVTEADSRAAERWLAACEAANAGVIERVTVARQLGWQPDGETFVTSQDAPLRVEPRYREQAPALAAHTPRGTLAGWRRAIERLEPYPVPQVGLYAGFAAPLLVPLGIDSFTIDFSGRSTRGKTITAGVGLSPWADPSEKGDGLLSWRTTMLAAEKCLNLVSGLPVVIDETRLVKYPELVDALLYQVPKNHGQPRGGGWPNMIPWRAIVLSTGEQPATSFTTHQGASARVLTICTAPFGAAGEESRAVADAVRGGCARNYGVAGPEFADRLRSALRRDGGLDELCKRHDELTARLRGGNDMTGRRAPLVACLALAAELGAEWGVVPLAPPSPDKWLAMFATADPRDNRPEMALDIVREFVGARPLDLWFPRRGDSWQPMQGWIGRHYRLAGNEKPTVVGRVPLRTLPATGWPPLSWPRCSVIS